jgi:hypothetical protein
MAGRCRCKQEGERKRAGKAHQRMFLSRRLLRRNMEIKSTREFSNRTFVISEGGVILWTRRHT